MKVPAFGSWIVFDPDENTPVSNDPSLAVMEWLVLSLLVTLTVAPACTVSWFGANLKLLMVMPWPVAAADVDDDDDDELEIGFFDELLHAPRATVAARLSVTTTSIRILGNLPTLLRIGPFYALEGSMRLRLH
jgi:hypothetical protein